MSAGFLRAVVAEAAPVWVLRSAFGARSSIGDAIIERDLRMVVRLRFDLATASVAEKYSRVGAVHLLSAAFRDLWFVRRVEVVVVHKIMVELSVDRTLRVDHFPVRRNIVLSARRFREDRAIFHRLAHPFFASLKIILKVITICLPPV